MTFRKTVSFLFLLLAAVAFAPSAHAQTHELALTGGGDFVTNGSFSVDPSFSVQLNYARRIIGVPLVGLYFEVPVAAGLETGVSPSGACAAVIGAACPGRFSSVFVTPGLKLKFSPPGVQPYFAIGGGWGHFRQTSSTGTSGSTNTGTVDYAGGVDLTLLPVVGLRGEVRDFYSGLPKFGLSGTSRQHNVFVTAGIVLRF